MDTCTKGSSSNTDNAGKMNVSICETYINGCVSEPTKKWERDQKPNNFWTNEAVPSTTKKIMCACTKISGHRIIASDNLFWSDSYQDPIDLDSKPGQLLVSLENMQVGGLSHGKTTSQWKIQNKSLHKEVMKCNNKGRSFFDSHRKFDEEYPEANLDKNWKDAWWNYQLTINILLMENWCQLGTGSIKIQ